MLDDAMISKRRVVLVIIYIEVGNVVVNAGTGQKTRFYKLLAGVSLLMAELCLGVGGLVED
jgi:hypothetical protein